MLHSILYVFYFGFYLRLFIEVKKSTFSAPVPGWYSLSLLYTCPTLPYVSPSIIYPTTLPHYLSQPLPTTSPTSLTTSLTSTLPLSFTPSLHPTSVPLSFTPPLYPTTLTHHLIFYPNPLILYATLNPTPRFPN